jgi:hypothetical protein
LPVAYVEGALPDAMTNGIADRIRLAEQPGRGNKKPNGKSDDRRKRDEPAY